MFKKDTQDKRSGLYSYLIVGLLLFHLIANFVWLVLDKNPTDFDPIGHTLITINSASYIRAHFSDFSLWNYMRLSPAYPNFVHTVGAVLSLILGMNWKIIAFTGTVFFVLA